MSLSIEGMLRACPFLDAASHGKCHGCKAQVLRRQCLELGAWFREPVLACQLADTLCVLLFTHPASALGCVLVCLAGSKASCILP